MTSITHILGIRHHGPGSARSVVRALEALRPDVILVEGPPDAEDVLPLAAHAEMRSPVALLVYAPDEPRRAVFYPFAIFSPEWQAIRFGLREGIPVRFMDLPQAVQLARKPEEEDAAETEAPEVDTEEPAELAEDVLIRRDPLAYLAEAAGYSDSERWWEHLVEQRVDSTDLFTGILEAMTALREAFPHDDPTEALREAHMRQTIRAAQREGFGRIAVVCGAWHGPALATMPTAKADADLLKGLPKIKVAATWVPWTYGRLSYWSGYGAGIEAPGWYHHLWQAAECGCAPQKASMQWLTRAAGCMREADIDVSTAHVIEASRLAVALAAMRERPVPGLDELHEAIRAVYCMGSDAPLAVIGQKLMVGERLGHVPEETPAVPLQQDLAREQRRLRLPPDPVERMLDLDQRNETDLGRSHLLHRLGLLGIPWGKAEQATGKLGTFHELWRLAWAPEFAVAVIEAASWGNTVADAAAVLVCDRADTADNLAALSHLLDRVLMANLPDALTRVMTRLESVAAVTTDVTVMMDAAPPLAQVMRYGNVRQTDTGMVAHVFGGLMARICIGLPAACAALNDDAAREMFPRVQEVHKAIGLVRDDALRENWQAALLRLADQQGLHGLIAGRATRLLYDAGALSADETARRLGLAISLANDPAIAGAWVEGFLHGSGLLILHDDALWRVLNAWVRDLPADTFDALLPLLRRTVATFPAAERRQIGNKARQAILGDTPDQTPQTGFDAGQADAAMAGLADLFGM